MEFIFSFLPVILFLFCLFMLDSFKLVNRKILLLCLIWGGIAALISYFLNTWLNKQISLNYREFSWYIAPLTEEITKVIFIIILISRQKIGFSIDAAIYGFAAGTGFALSENMVYLLRLGSETGMIIWILRGFGTALMHGGSTALIAMLVIGGIQRDKPLPLVLIPALFAGYLLHSAFNHFFLNPFLQTALIFMVLPLLFTVVFQKSNSVLQDWLEIEFGNEVEMLRMIRQGKFSDTRAGSYLVSLRKHFNPEMMVDLYCYISLYLELSIKAKRNLMLKENGFPLFEEPEIDVKLKELKQLRKQIGKIGELAMKPLVRMKHRELWKLNLLKK